VNQFTDTASLAQLAGEAGFHPIEERLRTNVPPAHQDTDRAALRRNRADAALGAAGLRADPDAQGRWGDPLSAHRAMPLDPAA
jgi:hypothetical protein